jgi:hypothetical protein
MDRAPIDCLARIIATRRASLGFLTAVGLLAVGASRDDAVAKQGRKRRRRKRKQRRPEPGQQPAPNGPEPGQEPAPEQPGTQCQALGVTCVPSQPSSCCVGLACDQTAAGMVCCQPEATPCASADGCCSGTCDFLVGGGTCAPCRGRTCSATKPCCNGLTCSNGYCGGCRDRATSCSSNTDCCFSECTSGACLSAAGGRCARDVDCKSCYLGHNCTNACVNGVCAV